MSMDTRESPDPQRYHDLFDFMVLSSDTYTKLRAWRNLILPSFRRDTDEEFDEKLSTLINGDVGVINGVLSDLGRLSVSYVSPFDGTQIEGTFSACIGHATLATLKGEPVWVMQLHSEQQTSRQVPIRPDQLHEAVKLV